MTLLIIRKPRAASENRMFSTIVHIGREFDKQNRARLCSRKVRLRSLPSPEGRGWTATAFSSAGAGRVRGELQGEEGLRFGVRQLAAAFLRRKLASGRVSSKLERQKRQQAAALQTCLLVAALSTLLPAAASARIVKDQTGRVVNVPENPHRLVSLAPNITEIVYALGLGDELVGDTDNCDFPPQAKNKPHVGTMVNPSLERIVALKPDLALGTPEANRRETADQLERLGIPLYGVTASTLAGTLASIEDLGRILGRAAEARSLVAQMQARIDRIEERIEGQPKPKVLFVVWYRPLITVGPNTFIADVVRAAGGIPIGDNLKGEWPRLTLEELLPQNPDVILFPKTESFSPSTEEFESLPGWKDLRAVKEGRMFFVSETIMRPGPRLVDALEELAGILHPGVACRNGDKPV